MFETFYNKLQNRALNRSYVITALSRRAESFSCSNSVHASALGPHFNMLTMRVPSNDHEVAVVYCTVLVQCLIEAEWTERK